MKEVGGGGKETLQMIRDDTEKLKLGYLNQAALFWVSALFIITTNKGSWAHLCTSVFLRNTYVVLTCWLWKRYNLLSGPANSFPSKNRHMMQMQSEEPPSAFPGWDGFSGLPSYIGLGSSPPPPPPFRKAASLSLNRGREQSCWVRGLRAGVDNSKALPAIFTSLLSCL